MEDTKQKDGETPRSDIADELRDLGQNLRDALRTAWEREERKKLQAEIESGLSSLGNSLNQAAKEFSESPTGQTIKADVEDIHERFRSGEVEAKVRSDLLSTLRTINIELRKVTSPETQNTPADTTQDRSDP